MPSAGVVGDALSCIRQNDLQGHLDEAVDLAIQNIHGLGIGASITARIDGYVCLARTLRHRGLRDDLRRSLDAANQAVRLAELPASPPDARPHALLELAAAKLACGDPVGLRDIAEPLTAPAVGRSETDPRVAARAWHLLGEAALAEDRIFEAIAALLNSVAERGRLNQRESTATPGLLLRAFSRAGHLHSADKLVKATNLESLGIRHRVDFLLRLAGHRRRSGHIAEALETLDDADRLIMASTGLDRAKAVSHWVRAACLREWRLARQAEEQRTSGDLLWDSSGDLTTQAQPRIHPRARFVFDFIERVAQGGGNPTGSHAQLLEKAVARLQGVPGMERSEALTLTTAGSFLSRGLEPVRATAERLLRRALARFDYLQGATMWEASCRCALGQALATSRPDAALELLQTGIQRLSEERYDMPRRTYRANWRATVEGTFFETAIRLAHEQGRKDLAADLIVFSRIGGVLVPEVEPNSRRVDEVPLLAPPQLVYLDGSSSTLGSESSCRLL